MNTVRVMSKNAAYQKFEVLRTNRNKRYRYGEFLVEGVRNINQAIRNGWQFTSLLYSPETPLSRWAQEVLDTVSCDTHYQLSANLMQELSGKTDTSELLAILRMRPDDPALMHDSPCPLYILFDRPSNHGNLGSIIRSADALGADGLILTGHGVDLYQPEVITASMGSFFNLPAIRMADNDTVFDWIARQRDLHPGFQVIGTTAHKQLNITQVDFRLPTLLMIGNETEGLCRAFKEGCDLLATIPMADTSSASSFNVACAATVMMYEVCRQRAQD